MDRGRRAPIRLSQLENQSRRHHHQTRHCYREHEQTLKCLSNGRASWIHVLERTADRSTSKTNEPSQQCKIRSVADRHGVKLRNTSVAVLVSAPRDSQALRLRW